MNIGFDFRRGEDTIPTSLDAMAARINTIFGKEHDNSSGQHTDIHADSVSVDGPIAALSLAVQDDISAGAITTPKLVADDIHGSTLTITGKATLGELTVQAGPVLMPTLNVTGLITSGSLTTGAISCTTITSSGLANLQSLQVQTGPATMPSLTVAGAINTGSLTATGAVSAGSLSAGSITS